MGEKYESTPPRPREDLAPSAAATANLAWSIVSYLLSGLLVWGGAGWLVDRLLGEESLFLPLGLLFGMAAAMFLVVKKINQS